MSDDRPAISIIVPLFNEEQSVEPLFKKLMSVLDTGIGEYEIIFVDDGSTDQSFTQLRRLAELNKNVSAIGMRRNFGKSASLQRGFHEARGRIVVTLDADLQDDPAEIPALLEKLKQGFDMAVGWKRDRQDPVSKTVPSRLFNVVVSVLTGVHLHDMNSGLKAMTSDVAKELRLYGELHRFIPVLAHMRGFSITEVPVRHHPRKYGRSKFGTSRMYRGFFDLITVLFLTRFGHRPLHVFGGLGLTFFVSGFGISSYLAVLWLQGEPIGTRPLLLLGVLLILVGIQMLSLGLMAEMFVRALTEPDDFPVREHVSLLRYDGAVDESGSNGD